MKVVSTNMLEGTVKVEPVPKSEDENLENYIKGYVQSSVFQVFSFIRHESLEIDFKNDFSLLKEADSSTTEV